ncbi:MAG: hypothetical protein KF777_03555 [Planctomycetaceae bacterium]|nr:hypothetical protein [Planctomycetaceae bacterium]
MSGIVFIAPFLAFLACGAVWLLFRIFRRKFPLVWLSRLGCAIPLMLFPFATVGFFGGLTNAVTKTGTNATPQVANNALLTFDVPSTATAVDFRHAYFSGTIDAANFTIAEEDFLSWLKSKGWKTRKFQADERGFHGAEPSAGETGNDSVWISPLRLGGDDTGHIEIKNGYEYIERDEVNLDAGFNVVYDRDTRRAYIWRTTF